MFGQRVWNYTSGRYILENDATKKKGFNIRNTQMDRFLSIKNKKHLSETLLIGVEETVKEPFHRMNHRRVFSFGALVISVKQNQHQGNCSINVGGQIIPTTGLSSCRFWHLIFPQKDWLQSSKTLQRWKYSDCVAFRSFISQLNAYNIAN